MENGDVYIGDMVDNKFSGKGKYKWVDGQLYQGEYRDGMEQGTGMELYPSGNAYFGEFADSNFNGKGTYKWLTG